MTNWQAKETYVVDGVTYTVHSAAALFPLLPPSIYEDLVADIRKHGIRQPVLVFGTEIVDGRNRVRAGLEAGVHIPIEQITDEETIYEIAASAILHRRSLVPSQRAYIAEQLHRMAVEARRERQALRDRARNRRWRLEHRGAGASPPHAGAGGDVAEPAGSAASSGGSAAAPTAGAPVTGGRDSVPTPGSRADERPSSAAPPAEARGAVSAAELVDGTVPESPAPEAADPPSAPDVPDVPEPMPAPTSADLARRMGVSERSVGRVRATLAAAPCLGPLLRLGQLNVRQAYAARNEPKELLEAAALIASGRQTSLRDALAEVRGGQARSTGQPHVPCRGDGPRCRLRSGAHAGRRAARGIRRRRRGAGWLVPARGAGRRDGRDGGGRFDDNAGGSGAAGEGPHRGLVAAGRLPVSGRGHRLGARAARADRPGSLLPRVGAVRRRGPRLVRVRGGRVTRSLAGSRLAVSSGAAGVAAGRQARRRARGGARRARGAVLHVRSARPGVGTLLGHRCLSALVVSERPPKIPSAGAPAWQAPLPMALYLFELEGDGGKVAEVLDYWGHVFTVRRSDQ